MVTVLLGMLLTSSTRSSGRARWSLWQGEDWVTIVWTLIPLAISIIAVTRRTPRGVAWLLVGAYAIVIGLAVASFGLFFVPGLLLLIAGTAVQPIQSPRAPVRGTPGAS